MPSRDDPVERATRRLRRSINEAIGEIREARLGAGLSQGAVGRRIGLSRSRVSRIELGQEPRVPAEVLGRMAAVVGLDLVVRAYPGSRVLRDVVQVRSMVSFRDRLGNQWRWGIEVRLDITGDQRAWDAVGTHRHTGLTIWVEVETRIRDAQALLRRLALKRRDGNATRLVLVVPDTRSNRAAIEEAGSYFDDAFPVRTRRAVPLLIAGRDPGGDVLLIL